MLQLYIKVTERLRGFAADDSGATGIEYGMVACCAAMMAISAVGMVGGEMADIFETIKCQGFPPICVVK